MPVWKRIDWKSADSFDKLRLILACLGAEGQYVVWDEQTGKEMTVKAWSLREFKAKSK